jgi:hypothetical protein
MCFLDTGFWRPRELKAYWLGWSMAWLFSEISEGPWPLYNRSCTNAWVYFTAQDGL